MSEDGDTPILNESTSKICEKDAETVVSGSKIISEYNSLLSAVVKPHEPSTRGTEQQTKSVSYLQTKSSSKYGSQGTTYTVNTRPINIDEIMKNASSSYRMG